MTVGGGRQTRRFLVDDCHVEVRWRSLVSLLSRYDMGPVVNLSLGGIQFIIFRPLRVGKRLRVGLRVKGQFGFIKSAAQVRWVQRIHGERAYRVGVSFEDLPKSERVKLEKMDSDYWPRQQEIQEAGIERLGLPGPIARKLTILIRPGYNRGDRSKVTLMRAGPEHIPVGGVCDLTAEQTGHGKWLDTSKGLVFKNPEASIKDRRAGPHSKPRDDDEDGK